MSRAKCGVSLREPVRIRFKELADGRQSIYLDIYYAGVRRYEFLRLYLLPGSQASIRRHNPPTLAAAEAVKARRIFEVTRSPSSLPGAGRQSRMLLIDWMEQFHASQLRKGVRGQ